MTLPNKPPAILVSALSDHYRFEAFLGKGGSASVHKVWNLRLERFEAFKVLLETHEHDEEFGDRFIQEAKLAASLDHPNIVKIYDFGEVGGTYWYSMQHVDGPTLAAELRARGNLDDSAAARLAVPLLDALEYSHRQGIVHRDIKPSNIILDGSGRPFLMDFGIAKSTGSMVKTRTGLVLGTPAYVAPEQAQGETIDGRADLYALGVTLYQALTGELPFTGANPLRMVVARLTTDPAPVNSKRPDMDPELAAVVMGALQRERESRFSTAAEMAEPLRLFLGESWQGTGVVPTAPAEAAGGPRPPSPLTSSDGPTVMGQRAARRRRSARLRWAGVGLAAAIVVAAVAYLASNGPERRDDTVSLPAGPPATAVATPAPTVAASSQPEDGPAVPPAPEPTAAPVAAPVEAAQPRIRRPVTQPRLLVTVEPELSGGLAALCSGRRLYLSVAVAEDGRVATVAARSSDHPEACLAPAVAAVEQYRYEPAFDAQGEPVEARVALVFFFPEVAHDPPDG